MALLFFGLWHIYCLSRFVCFKCDLYVLFSDFDISGTSSVIRSYCGVQHNQCSLINT